MFSYCDTSAILQEIVTNVKIYRKFFPRFSSRDTLDTVTESDKFEPIATADRHQSLH